MTTLALTVIRSVCCLGYVLIEFDLLLDLRLLTLSKPLVPHIGLSSGVVVRLDLDKLDSKRGDCPFPVHLLMHMVVPRFG